MGILLEKAALRLDRELWGNSLVRVMEENDFSH
jgi:hypothetical protein